MLAVFARHLAVQRRLAPLTVTGTVGVVRRLLATLPADLALPELTDAQVHRVVRAEVDRLSIGATRTSLSALRVFLRFLFATGRHRVDPSLTVPSVAGARLALDCPGQWTPPWSRRC